jgi:hypothetical protein
VVAAPVDTRMLLPNDAFVIVIELRRATSPEKPQIHALHVWRASSPVGSGSAAKSR